MQYVMNCSYYQNFDQDVDDLDLDLLMADDWKTMKSPFVDC